MSWKWRLVPIVGGAGVLVAVAAAIMLATGRPSMGTVVPDFAEPQVMGMEEEVALRAGKGVAAVSYGEVLNRMDSSTLEQDVEIKDRLIIRTADLSIVVDDTAESMAAIEDLVGQAEGWVVSPTSGNTTGPSRATSACGSRPDGWTTSLTTCAP